MSQLVDSIFYIPLETQAGKLIGSISKIIFKNNRVYILDKTNSLSISCFDMQGHLIFYLNRTGLGPGEYLNPEDMVVLSDGTVVLYDLAKRSIIKYNSDGEFIHEFHWDLYVDQLCVVGKNDFLVYAPDNNIVNGTDHSFVFFRVTNDEVDPLIHLKKYREGKDDFYEPGVMYYFNDTVTVAHGLDNLIYYYANYKFGNRFRVNFGGHAAPQDLLDKGSEHAEVEFYKKEYASMIHRLIETENLFSFQYHRGNKICWAVYEINTGKVLNIDTLVNDLNFGELSYPIAALNDFLVGYIYPYNLKDHLNQISAKKKAKDSSMYISEPFNTMLDTINDYDNPILFAVRLHAY